MRYVTNEQRRRRTLFKPTSWAVACWMIFRVAHCLRIDNSSSLHSASPNRGSRVTRLKVGVCEWHAIESESSDCDRVVTRFSFRHSHGGTGSGSCQRPSLSDCAAA